MVTEQHQHGQRPAKDSSNIWNNEIKRHKVLGEVLGVKC
jgi:hypothetical protein